MKCLWQVGLLFARRVSGVSVHLVASDTTCFWLHVLRAVLQLHGAMKVATYLADSAMSKRATEQYLRLGKAPCLYIRTAGKV